MNDTSADLNESIDLIEEDQDKEFKEKVTEIATSIIHSPEFTDKFGNQVLDKI